MTIPRARNSQPTTAVIYPTALDPNNWGRFQREQRKRSNATSHQTKRGYASQRTLMNKKALVHKNEIQSRGKDSHFFNSLQIIRWRISKGGTFTQGELATMTDTNTWEIPTFIAELRRQGMLIRQAEPYAGRKIYWIEKPATWRTAGEIAAEVIRNYF